MRRHRHRDRTSGFLATVYPAEPPSIATVDCDWRGPRVRPNILQNRP
jgi:hypothetical protein